MIRIALGAAFRRLSLGWLLIAASSGASSQTASLRVLQHDEGLDNLAVMALAQAADGRVWIGTENGVFRFDGDHAEKMSPPATAQGSPSGMQAQTAGALLATSDGRMWVGWRAGLHVWSPKTQEMQPVGTVPIPVDDGQTLAASRDGVWVVSQQKLLHVDARTSKVSLVSGDKSSGQDVVLSVLADSPDGPLWSGCGKQLCRWTASQGLVRLGPAEGIPEGRWASALRTRDGSLWIRSDTRLLRSAAGDSRFVDVTPSGLAGRTVHWQLPMSEDLRGRVLLHTDGGMLRWDAGRWQAIGRTEGVEVAGGVHAMLVDRSGDLWLGTAGLGVMQWRGYQHWRHWTRAQGLPSDEAWSFADDEHGRVWIGSGDGAVLLDPARASLVETPRDGGQQVGSLLRARDGQLWQSTFAGELRRRRGSGDWQVVAKGLPLVYQLIEHPDGRLLAGTQSGLYEVRDAGGEHVRIERLAPGGPQVPESHPPDVRQMCLAPGGVWVATQTGLELLQPGDMGIAVTARGLPARPVTALGCGLNGEVWIVYGFSELWHLRSDTRGDWLAEPLREPLLDGRLKQSVLQDRRGWLWIGTDRGLVVHTPGGWKRLDRSAGLIWEDTNAGALFEDATGRIWVGTSRGISVYDDPATVAHPEPPVFGIERVRQADRQWANPGEVSLNAKQPVLIDWYVSGFAHRPGVQVRYRFGDDARWTPGSMDGARFEALPPGLHRLQAQAMNTDLGTASEIVSIELVVPMPWWNTWPAWMAAVAATFAIGLLIHRRRLNALRKREAELETLVLRRTAELKASRDELERLALTDALTGTMNRRAIMQAAQREHDRFKRVAAPLTIALLDIDHFKRVNDTYGHPAGDTVLVEVAGRLRAAMRPYDLLGRYGGEEFLMVMPGFEPHDGTDLILQRLQTAVGATPIFTSNADELRVTCSIGVACLRNADEPLAATICRADAALYRAKQSGRNRVVTSD